MCNEVYEVRDRKEGHNHKCGKCGEDDKKRCFRKKEPAMRTKETMLAEICVIADSIPSIKNRIEKLSGLIGNDPTGDIREELGELRTDLVKREEKIEELKGILNSNMNQ